jgi:ELWxxDGT repeat protein
MEKYISLPGTISTARKIWKTNGTTEGTKLLRDIYPGATDCDAGQLTVSNEWLFFIARDNEQGYELWKSDGTTNGTSAAGDIVPARVFLLRII